VSFVKSLGDSYDVTVVSPRNYFLFSPLLPSCTVGTLEDRTCAPGALGLPEILFVDFLFSALCNLFALSSKGDSGKIKAQRLRSTRPAALR
jgi:hypothetical protein